ncbi:MAG: translation initiation factor IF-3 [Bacteroidia bacterium]|nr:translation initiation factor IF-3 [Bacteroidia bacterium]MDW8159401.1 translation initiation factor IF-3 [Bacteroidia bacterium]
MSKKGREFEHRINDEIDAPEVRIVGEEDESLNGIYPIEKALKLAEARGVDLVEVTRNASPPVCRIIEYSKFRYEQKKREKESKSKQHVVVMKEIRFGPNTDDHDFNFKVRHAQNFLMQGNKIKAYVVFHGRSIVHLDRGQKILEDFIAALENYAKVESPPKMEGKRMYLILAPKPKK